MGEEVQKPAEEKKGEEAKKAEEEKKEEPAAAAEKPSGGGDEKKKEQPKAEQSKEDPPPPPPPPQEIVLRVFMHCEGCARKVRRCLKGFPGVEDVQTDCKTHKVVVKGEKADPLKVLERVQKKSHRQVELLSPIPQPPAEQPKKEEVKEEPKPEEKKEEPQVITVILKVHMHCEACAQEIRKRILRMKGVETAEPDLKSSQVTVKGTFGAANLVEYVHKRTGKHAVIVKQDPPPPEKKEEEDKGKDGKDEKKGEEGSGDKKDGDKKGEEAGGDAKPKEGEDAASKPGGGETEQEDVKVVELRKNEFYYLYPQNYQVYPARFAAESSYAYPPAPQMFSDENPNACSVM